MQFYSCLGLLLAFILLCGPLAGQHITVSGYVQDADSKENLIGATVYDRNSMKGKVSNAYGYFSLSLPATADSLMLLVNYLGYMPQVLRVPARDTSLTILLKPEATMLREVAVVASEEAEALEMLTQMSSISIPTKQIKLLPALLGEVDLIKVLQLMPGVQSGTEGGSGLYVRGGGPDQNLILLDGVPVYNVSHLFGFFSIFNTDAVNRVELIKGGFPARYGGRLSSVLDISLKEGNMQEFGGEGAVGIVSSKLTLEGPLIKDKASFMVSGRRTYIDLLARPFIRAATGGNETVGYHFHDINAKFNYKLSDKDRVYLSMYTGLDKAFARYNFNSSWGETREETGLQWGNFISALRWNHVYGKKLFSNLTLTYSEYAFDVFYEESVVPPPNTPDRRNEFFSERYLSGIYDWGAKMDFDYYPTANHAIRFGGSAIYHTFTPGALSYMGETQSMVQAGSRAIYATEAALYVEDEMRLSDRLSANLGFHASAFWVNSQAYTSFQPRLSARYLLPKRWALKASYSEMAQFIHLLTNAGIGLPTDLWVPATEQVKPQQAQQFALGVAKTLGQFELSVEGYYKQMDNLIEYREGASFLDVEADWQEKVEAGQGWSYGMEVLFQKKAGKTTGWVGYTLAWANRRFQELNFGRMFPYRYDRRHDISLALVHAWKPNIDFSMAWVYGTGNAVTLPIAVYEPLDFNQLALFRDPQQASFSSFSQLEHFDGRNGFRMRAYHRMDISLAFKKQKRRGERTWTLAAYNAYSRLNPFFIGWGYDYNTEMGVYKQYSLFPIIPSVSYAFKF